jgi:hypothetical protein
VAISVRCCPVQYGLLTKLLHRAAILMTAALGVGDETIKKGKKKRKSVVSAFSPLEPDGSVSRYLLVATQCVPPARLTRGYCGNDLASLSCACVHGQRNVVNLVTEKFSLSLSSTLFYCCYLFVLPWGTTKRSCSSACCNC